MVVKIERILYPSGNKESSNGYTILLVTCLDIKDSPITTFPDGRTLLDEKFVIVGNYLPTSPLLRYKVEDGIWSKSKRGEDQLMVSSMTEIIVTNEEGIIAYLSSGLIKGIGPVTARKIYKKFGDDTLNILDEDPTKLKEISGITDKKYDKIVESYQMYRKARSVVAELAKYDFSASKSVLVYQKFKNDAIDIIKYHPYKLCEVKGIGFITADYLAVSQGLDLFSSERVYYCILDILKKNELNGNLYIYINNLYAALYKALKYDATEASQMLIKSAIKELVDNNKIKISKHPIDSKFIMYRQEAYKAEDNLAHKIVDLLKKPTDKIDIESEIEEHELLTGVRLAPQQKEAVACSLSNWFSVITGGPGTGKTTIIDFIIRINAKLHPDSTTILCAPTGKAARRMTASTGIDSYTVHKVLELTANEEGVYDDTAALIDSDLLIVDETSMLDNYLSSILMSNLSPRTKVVFIGDVDQLPSVGAGAVLQEIIESNVVPVVKLTEVYRQASDSKIATNAALIKHGNWSLDYDKSFEFISVNTFDEASETMVSQYMRAIDEVGIDDVIMLSPQRTKTPTGVNLMNATIHDIVNPPSSSKEEVTVMGQTFRKGDRVMQMKNFNEVANGEVGEILSITNDKISTTIQIDFDSERVVEYNIADMASVSLAYTTTIHKSQGSEYDTVIINLMSAHGIMLKRNLVYTAITRAKNKVIIIGEKAALIEAIKHGFTDSDRRLTLLGERLKLLISK